ncbi:MAG: hypothetical protein R2864_03490 [Syntrophotaleaceae bacterium]
MVRSALGISQERGDQLVVISRPFESDFTGQRPPSRAPALTSTATCR